MWHLVLPITTPRYHYKLIIYILITFVVQNNNNNYVQCLNIIMPGGTGIIGQTLSSMLKEHDVTILARNKFLASSPTRVLEDFGWVGSTFLQNNKHVKLRDYDGGDLLDIVGCDWIGLDGKMIH